MKKLATFVFALLLGASLSFAQSTGGSTKTTETPKTGTSETGKKGGKTKTKSHKGGKKGKKSSGGTTTPAPK
jgi:basic membrane lipoprotein Med (substrate-binding protein (PBP1-ABC) superfamily)